MKNSFPATFYFINLTAVCTYHFWFFRMLMIWILHGWSLKPDNPRRKKLPYKMHSHGSPGNSNLFSVPHTQMNCDWNNCWNFNEFSTGKISACRRRWKFPHLVMHNLKGNGSFLCLQPLDVLHCWNFNESSTGKLSACRRRWNFSHLIMPNLQGNASFLCLQPLDVLNVKISMKIWQGKIRPPQALKIFTLDYA